jgi:peptidoglycan-binding protein ArfA
MDSQRDDGAVTDYRTEIGHYRRPLLGVPWIAALIVVPALLAGLGLGVRPAESAAPTPSPTAATPGASTPASTAASFGVSLSADGKIVTLSGTVPDAAAKAALVKAAQTAYGTSVSVVDSLSIVAGTSALSGATFTTLAAALKGVAGLVFNVGGSTVTIAGAPATDAARIAVLTAINKAYPAATVDSSGLVVAAPATTPPVATGPATPAPTAKATATATAPAAPTCATAADYVAGVTAQTKILFDSKTAALTTQSQAALVKIATLVKGCPKVKLLVAGNTDWVGDPDANKKLSLTRANAVKDALVKLGVGAANITTVGNGETKPIADNGTLAGLEANRRVDITVQ